jgi:hypothetical protein
MLICVISMIILVEAITQIIVKSFIFQVVRDYLVNKAFLLGDKTGSYIEELVNCGYCVSFWVAVVINLIFYAYVDLYPTIVYNVIINFFIVVLIVHRFSNIFHGSIDKYFDASKDIRYSTRQD